VKVKVLPSEHEFDVDAGETVLQAAIRQGVGLPYGCQDGACGSCKCRLVDGPCELGDHQLKALSPAERDAGYVLSCRTLPRGDLVIECPELPAAGVFPVRKLPCRVLSMQRAAPDVVVMRLQLPANDTFAYHPGQYIQFILRDGSRRAYSMANAPDDSRQIELHLRHMPGGKFTDHVFGAMREKEILRLEGPYGSFYLRDEPARPLVLLASGTGFAPIKAIIEALRARGSAPATVLYWGCRRRADLYLHDWVTAQAAELDWLDYRPVLSEPTPEDAWSGRTGLVHEVLMAELPDLSAHAVYACGAPAMVDAARRDLVERCALPAEHFHADAFTPAGGV
jgi:CDP-4-dehydro-6-deoxyglucose reductase